MKESLKKDGLGLLEWTRVQFSDYTVHNIPLPRFSMVLIDSRLTEVIWS